MVRILLAALLLTACSVEAKEDGVGKAQLAPSTAVAQDYGAIAFEIKSWGHVIRGWNVSADGTVRHVKIDGSPFADHRVEHREFAVDAAAYARLAALAAALPSPRLDRNQCEERATDLPYGTLHLSRGKQQEEIAFDSGCLDAPYQAFMDQLMGMDELVGGWVGQRPADSVEEVSGRS